MSGAVTTRELLDAIHEVKPHVEKLTENYMTAANRYVVAKRAFEVKEAEAFLEAKKDKVSDETAKRIALLKAIDERTEMDALLEDKRANKLGGEAWGSLLQAISATSYALNSEIKNFSYGGTA